MLTQSSDIHLTNDLKSVTECVHIYIYIYIYIYVYICIYIIYIYMCVGGGGGWGRVIQANKILPTQELKMWICRVLFLCN